MTIGQYFEENNIPFVDVMKEYRRTGSLSFDMFLKLEVCIPKFKIGDIIVLDKTKETSWSNNVVFRVKDIYVSTYALEFLTPSHYNKIGDIRTDMKIDLVDKVCDLY